MLTEQQQAELLSGFGPWVAKQPADRHFDYINNEECAFAQYLRASGYAGAHCDSISYRLSASFGHSYKLPKDLNEAIASGAWTFGALAERLELAGWLNRAPQEDAGKPIRLSPETLTAGML